MVVQGVSDSFRATIVSLGQYLLSNKDSLMQMVTKQHKDDLPQNVSIIKMARNYAEDLLEEEPDPATPATVQARAKRTAFGIAERSNKLERWKNHKRAGLFPKELEKPYIDKEESFKWLKKGKLGYENEKIILAAQDQGLMTNGFKKMAKISQNDQCRFCHAAVESTSHLVSACQIMLADGHYTARHNKVCRYIHWAICNHYKIDTQPVWLHEPQPTTATEDITIFYDKAMLPGRYIEGKAIKPDIVIWDKRNKEAKIIEVSVPNDFGLNRAERHKVNKYQDLKNDLRQTLQLETIDIIPVIVGATGLIKTNLKTYLKDIPGSPSAEEIQMCAITGTVSIIKRALSH